MSEISLLDDYRERRIEGKTQNPHDKGNGSGGPGGPGDMESRLAKLEAHAEHMQTGIGEIKGDLNDVSKDVQAIRVRLAWGSGAAAVIIGLLAWLANNRFDQVVEMITK
ncbi:hypothetical protein [Alloalcanivorax venustensis]|jgi:hypothetical protein|uniref:hypothetical protein n=1 Tax=Alloalcanivorax venustensis TaxID=172371 RepID=UPI0039E62E5D